jgi:hypothetical protein
MIVNRPIQLAAHRLWKMALDICPKAHPFAPIAASVPAM